MASLRMDAVLERAEAAGPSEVAQLSLARMALTEVPPVLTHLPNLTELNLSRNALTSLEGLAPLRQLRSLSVYFNKVSSVSEVLHLKAATALQTLDLRLNACAREEGYRSFVLYHLPSVTMLDEREVREFEREKAADIKTVRFEDGAAGGGSAASPGPAEAMAEVAAAVGAGTAVDAGAGAGAGAGGDVGLTDADLRALSQQVQPGGGGSAAANASRSLDAALNDAGKEAPGARAGAGAAGAAAGAGATAIAGAAAPAGSAPGDSGSIDALLADPAVDALPAALRTAVLSALSRARDAVAQAAQERARHASEESRLRDELRRMGSEHLETKVELDTAQAQLQHANRSVRVMQDEILRQKLRVKHEHPTLDGQMKQAYPSPEMPKPALVTYTVALQTDVDGPPTAEAEAQTDITGDVVAAAEVAKRGRRRSSSRGRSPGASPRRKSSASSSGGRTPGSARSSRSEGGASDAGGGAAGGGSGAAAASSAAAGPAISRELLGMLRESHAALKASNTQLVAELAHWRTKYVTDAHQWQRNFDDLRRRHEAAVTQLAASRAGRIAIGGRGGGGGGGGGVGSGAASGAAATPERRHGGPGGSRVLSSRARNTNVSTGAAKGGVSSSSSRPAQGPGHGTPGVHGAASKRLLTAGRKRVRGGKQSTDSGGGGGDESEVSPTST